MRYMALIQKLTSDRGSGNLLMFQSAPELARSARGGRASPCDFFVLESPPEFARSARESGTSRGDHCQWVYSLMF
jgi:hypothetical protein